MRDADTVLGIIRVRGEKRLPLEDVYRQLFNPTLYLKAYGKIYRNAGAMTKGMTDETADGMSLKKIESIIEEIRFERFRWTSVRRVYIPKKDGKQRPLGIPTWKDKLVQEVLRLILEAYYEPNFRGSSHGFRPTRGCHTALSDIHHNWKGTKWLIEGDIKGYFDNIDHEILLAILGENIHDNRFLALIKALCRAGYCDDWRWHTTLSGVPQGGIISPILANIYLDRLDSYVEDELIPMYTKGTRRKTNPEYGRFSILIAKHRKEGDYTSAERLIKLRRTLPSGMTDDPDYRRLRYIRYADDFLLGYMGTKIEAQEIKDKLKTFLKEQLHLDLSEEKTLITHAASERAKFLGYEISALHADDYIFGNRRTINGIMGLRMPNTFVNKICQTVMADGRIMHRAELMNDNDFSIVSQYQSELHGYYQYYQMATNANDLYKVQWVLGISLLKTLAAKHKTSVTTVLKLYKTKTHTPHGEQTCFRVKVPRPNKDPLVATYGGIPLRRNIKAVIHDKAIHTFKVSSNRTELLKRLLANECEVCGKEDFTEVHHIRALKDLKVPGRKEKPQWMKVMSARRRKTLVLCRECHDDLHAGRPMKFRDVE